MAARRRGSERLEVSPNGRRPAPSGCASKVSREGRGYTFVTFIDDIFQHIHGKVEPKFAFKLSIGKNRPSDVDYLKMQEKLVAVEEGASSWLRPARAASAIVVCAYDAPLHTSSHHVQPSLHRT